MTTKTLPYLASPGSLKNALERIKKAATPERVTRDFVTTKLLIKGGTGAALIPYWKKIGFVAADGSPTSLYKSFRNDSASGAAAAEAVRIGYKALGEVNEHFFDLDDKALSALIVQVTGAAQNDKVAKLTLMTLKCLTSLANFEATPSNDATEQKQRASASDSETIPNTEHRSPHPNVTTKIGLSYTINLNLPATSDQAVFNAIFRSLKEHLLGDE